MFFKISMFASSLLLFSFSTFALGQMNSKEPNAHNAQEPSSTYMKETMTAMDTMHKNMMDNSKIKGTPDHDFLVMMIPHHKGAIEMAEIILKHGKNEKIKKLAREIISAQEKEIAQMEKWIKDGIGAKN